VEHEESQKRTLSDLEWPELCEIIAKETLSDLGRARALALGPAPDQDVAEVRLSVMSEVLALHRAGSAIPAGMFRDVTSTAELLRREGVASGVELREMGRMLTVATQLDRYGEQHEESAPQLGRVLAVDPQLSIFARQLSQFIDEDGRVRDEASPGLAQARRALLTLRGQVQRRVEELIVRYREALQDGYFAQRDGRYVLPVRSDAPFRVEGIVLGTSASGSTLYVEPVELGQLGNKLRMLELDVEREEALVLSALSEEIAPYAEETLWALDVCARADLLRACALFAVKVQAVVVPFDEPGAMDAKVARHPLLCLADIHVVPSDLRLAPGRALVASASSP
jgi:DNA mismatch repair protein MutS2